ncbi:MAG: aminopeptidase P family protein, partial [Thermomicrobiales bacterium]|nr:aminopeptidase P family protein [Thermomicrobiales bacterium]
MSDRLSRLRAVMADRGVDAAIVSHPANRAYLSGFFADDHGPDEPTAMLLVEPRRARLLASVVNLPWAAASVRGDVEAVDWGIPWPLRLGETIKESGARRVGIEENALTVGALDAILEGLEGAAEIERLGTAVDRLRAVKDADELAVMEEAIRITDEAFVAATKGLAADTTERELADRLDRAMRDRGASGPAFDTIVAAG